jgi:predicted phosphodiesterase
MIIIVSDIHGNLEALQAVLARVGDGDTVVCAGDVVGYGPDPNECCDILREGEIECVMGNHDFVCANLDRLDEGSEGEGWTREDRLLCGQIFEQKNSVAQRSSRWTNEVLTAGNKGWLRGLPLRLEVHGLTLVHGKPGSMSDMLNEYVLPGWAADRLSDEMGGHLLVVGHSHLPMRTAHVVNPGSVGQPRDRNWMASYAVLDPVRFKFPYIRDEDMSFRFVDQVVKIYRVPYDIAATIQKIKDEPGLPDSLGDRLPVGL